MKKNKIIASVVMLLVIFMSYQLYHSEYNIRDNDTDIENAIMEFTAPFGSNRGVKNPVIIGRKKVDNKLLVFYGDRAVEGLFGFTSLHRGVNGKYQIRSTNYGGGNFHIVGYGFTTSKGNYIAVGGSDYSNKIVSYKAYPIFAMDDDKLELLNGNVKGNTFLNIHRVDNEHKFPTIKIFNAKGIDITRELCNDYNDIPSGGVGKAELFMLNVLIFIILTIGFIISKYFWTYEQLKQE